jgi:hypothetical protein
MIAVMLIAGLTLLIALCVGGLVAPLSCTLTENTLEQPRLEGGWGAGHLRLHHHTAARAESPPPPRTLTSNI